MSDRPKPQPTHTIPQRVVSTTLGSTMPGRSPEPYTTYEVTSPCPVCGVTAWFRGPYWLCTGCGWTCPVYT